MKKLPIVALFLLTCTLIFGCAKNTAGAHDNDSDDTASSASEGTSETTTAAPSLSLPDIQELFAVYQTRYSLSEIKQGESAITCKNGDSSLTITADNNGKAIIVSDWIVSFDPDELFSNAALQLPEPLAVYASMATGKEITGPYIVERLSEVEATETTTDGGTVTATITYTENGIRYKQEFIGVPLSESKVIFTLMFTATAITDGADSPEPEPIPACDHNFTEATCTDPKTCTLCGMTEGYKNDHELISPTCTTPVMCTACGSSFGSAPGHAWNEATCTTPATCSRCKITSGEALGHDIFVTKCKNCDYTDFSSLAKTYTNINAYDFIYRNQYDVQNVSISSDGVFSFTFKGNDYHLQLEQTDRWYQNTDLMIFDCYVDGVLDSDVQVRVDTTYMIPELEWLLIDGCFLAIYAAP